MVNLNSCHAKLSRARLHKEALEEEIRIFGRSNAQNVASEIDNQTGEKFWSIKGPITNPPDSLSLVLGDALYNYRAALDHLAWSVVEKCGGIPNGSTAYPICAREEIWNGRGTKDKISGMSPQAIAMVKAEQPCYAKNPVRGRNLSSLNLLNNVDKHRHLHLVVTGTDGGLFSEPLPVHFVNLNLVYQGPVDNQTILAHVPSDYNHVDFFPAFGITFDPGRPEASGESVIDVIYSIDFIVDGIVSSIESVLFP